MRKNKSFTTQLIILGGFIIFFYMFFALAASIYRDYKLETQIDSFEEEINELAFLARKKPDDVAYFSSEKFKDRYAKESLNLLNIGEKVIIIPDEDQIVEKGPLILMTESITPKHVLSLPRRYQWWEYFFGNTLSVIAEPETSPEPVEGLEPEGNPESLDG